MKCEKAMGEVLKSVARECHSEPVAQQLKKIAKAFVGNRVLVFQKQQCEKHQCG